MIARRRADAAQRGAAQRGGELRVLLDEGALHLLEQSQLLFGERHGVLLEGRPMTGVCDPSIGSRW